MNRHNWNNLSESTQKALREQQQYQGGSIQPDINSISGVRQQRSFQPRTQGVVSQDRIEVDPTKAGGNEPGDGHFMNPKYWGEGPDCDKHPCANMEREWNFQGCDANGVCTYTKLACDANGCTMIEWVCFPGGGCHPQTVGDHRQPGEWDDYDELPTAGGAGQWEEAYQRGYHDALNEETQNIYYPTTQSQPPNYLNPYRGNYDAAQGRKQGGFGGGGQRAMGPVSRIAPGNQPPPTTNDPTVKIGKRTYSIREVDGVTYYYWEGYGPNQGLDDEKWRSRRPPWD